MTAVPFGYSFSLMTESLILKFRRKIDSVCDNLQTGPYGMNWELLLKHIVNTGEIAEWFGDENVSRIQAEMDELGQIEKRLRETFHIAERINVMMECWREAARSRDVANALKHEADAKEDFFHYVIANPESTYDDFRANYPQHASVVPRYLTGERVRINSISNFNCEVADQVKVEYPFDTKPYHQFDNDRKEWVRIITKGTAATLFKSYAKKDRKVVLDVDDSAYRWA